MGRGKRSAKRNSRAVTTSTRNSPAQDKSSVKPVTGKDLILTFAVFFLIFGLIGYLRGRSIRNKPERLRLDVLSRLALGERNGQKIIAYQCNGQNEVSWDIDKDALFTARTLTEPAQFAFSPAIIDNDSLTTAFLTGGGVASIFTAREMLAFATAGGGGSKLLREGHVQLIVTALLAVVSGYEICYPNALHTNSNCGDARFTG